MQKESATAGFGPLARGVAQSGVRIANERAVLTLIAQNPGASNADVARMTGLGPQTTSRIVSELELRGLITRGDVLRGRRGQPATPLFLDPHGAYTIGVEIGWRHLEVLLFEMSGKTLASVRRSHAWPDANTIFADVAAEIATIQSGMSDMQRQRLAGVGVASPSYIERNIGRLGAPDEQKALWQGLDIAGRLERDTGLPVHWFNDGSAACWSELIAQPTPRPLGFAYMQVGTFVGAGIVVNGDLWEGPSGNAANLGAIMVSDADGKPTYVHLVASLIALQQQLEKVGQSLPSGSPLNWDWDAMEPVVTRWLDRAGLALAKAVISTRAVIELDKAIIDGVMPRVIVERLLERVRYHIAELPSLASERPQVGMGHLGASAAATGAAQLVLFHQFFSRAWNLFAT
ncbi:ROK family transcriptional regulator [Devosia sp. SL43]|uniref:ROK family transcriptional regulator n=1 Tax=Devosia sp. SL43 TaxID=2806348 RepID=UPI001F3CDE03|nr:ROK family transcriptional regulator [Devosia sp. SL43]UJW85183.1 ROK family transcriptional regulator [Devosia sp. SL43]